MIFQDYYRILGVHQNASESEIRTAYRKLSKKFHPDVNDGDKYFEDRFKEIQEAYETLGDAMKRKVYDDRARAAQTSETPVNTETSKNGYSTKTETEPYPFKRTRRKFASSRFVIIIVVTIVLGLFRRAMNDSIVSNTVAGYSSQMSAAPKSTLSDSPSAIMAVADSETLVQPVASKAILGTILKYKGKLIPIESFPTDMDTTFFGKAKRTFPDLDRDGTPEIMTEYYSGGAHCCNVFNVFALDSDGNYRNIFEYAGDVKEDGNRLCLDFFETVGYFLSCYNCSVEDSITTNEFKPEINILYADKRFFLAPNNPNVDLGLTTDLTSLYYKNMPPLDSMNFDNGMRKAIASRIIVYYYNNQADLQKTKYLFYRFYPWNDKDFVWNEITEYIIHINTELSPYVSLN